MAEPAKGTVEKKKKPARLVVLQPGRGRKHPDARVVKVMASARGYYDHRRIAKGEVFTIYLLGDGLPSWCVIPETREAKLVLRELAQEDQANKGRKGKLPNAVAPSSSSAVARQLEAESTDEGDEDDDGAGGGKQQGAPVGDEDDDSEESVI